MNEIVILSASKLAFSLQKIRNPLRLWWLDMLPYFTREKLDEPLVRHYIGIGTWNPYKSLADLETGIQNLEKQTIAEVYPLLQMFYDEADARNEKDTRNTLKKILKLLKNNLDEKELSSSQRQLQKYKDDYLLFNNRERLFIPITIKPLIADFLLRIGLLIIYQMGWINSTYYWISFLAITLPVFIYAQVRSNKNKINNLKLIAGIKNVHHFRISKNFNETNLTILFFLLVIQSFIISIITTKLIFLGVIPLLLIYYVLYLLNASEDALKIAELIKQDQQRFDFQTRLSQDENDEQIVYLETDFNSIHSRLEAYVLESALFGALAFSGFLQIIAENLISFEDLTFFSSNAYELLQGLTLLESEQIQNSATNLMSKKSLFSLVSIETILCSAFFLAVISARLRYSDMSDQLQRELEMAKSFNKKEDELLMANRNSDTKRAAYLNEKIHYHLFQAYKNLDALNPISRFMRFFRNAGIFIFLLILISSSLFVSGILGLILVVLSIAYVFYFNRKVIYDNVRLVILSRTNQYINAMGWIILLMGSEFTIGFILKVYHFPLLASIFVFFAFLHLGLLRFIQIAVSPPLDKKMVVEHSPFLRGVKLVWAISEWTFYISLFLLLESIPGGRELFTLSIILMIISIIPTVAQLSKRNIIRVSLTLVFVLAYAGVVFKLLHLPGSMEIMFFSLILIIGIIVYTYRLGKRLYHNLLQIQLLATLLVIILFTTGVFSTIAIMYEHRTMNLSEAQRIENLQKGVNKLSNFQPSEDLESFNKEFEFIESELGWYLQNFSYALSDINPAYRFRHMESPLIMLYGKFENTQLEEWKLPVLSLIYSLGEHAEFTIENSRYYFKYIDVIYESGHQNIALHKLQSIHRNTKNKELKKLVADHLNSTYLQ